MNVITHPAPFPRSPEQSDSVVTEVGGVPLGAASLDLLAPYVGNVAVVSEGGQPPLLLEPEHALLDMTTTPGCDNGTTGICSVGKCA